MWKFGASRAMRRRLFGKDASGFRPGAHMLMIRCTNAPGVTHGAQLEGRRLYARLRRASSMRIS